MLVHPVLWGKGMFGMFTHFSVCEESYFGMFEQFSWEKSDLGWGQGGGGWRD